MCKFTLKKTITSNYSLIASTHIFALNTDFLHNFTTYSTIHLRKLTHLNKGFRQPF
jgi:hypothetical protein